MAEESPLSPNSHKRRIADMVTPHDHPTLNLSLLPYSEVEPSSSLEFVGIPESQEADCFPQQSPKKPKFENSISAVIVESNSNLDDGKPEFQEMGTLVSKEKVKFDVKIEVSELKLDEKNDVSEMGFEQNEVSEVGFEKNEVSEVGFNVNEVSEVKFDEINEVSEVGFEKNEVIGGNSSEIGENFGVIESGELVFEKKSENLDGVLLQKLLKKEDSSKSSLKIEVIDGTALLDVSLIGEKKNKRRGNNNNNKMKNNSRNNGVNEGKKRCMYSRKELELLRYVNVKGQRKFWQEIYDGLSAIVKKDYDEVGSFRFQRNGGSNSEYNGGKKSFNDGGIMGGCFNGPYCNNRGILGESCSENVSCEEEIISCPSCLHDDHNSGKDLLGEWIEDEESDDEYECIHRPAFKVEGEPDFESGPPEDGLEYLRRVRWEAKQIPKVKIAKLANIKPRDQSVYMPEIPDIEECPPHLAPLKQWEDEFIADFSKLRLELSRHEDANDAVSTDSESVIFARHGPKSHSPSQNSASIELSSGGPMLSTVLAMDLVSRVATLRKRINLFESASDLSKDVCAWLFALCAAIDTPLDADTSASLRCLLRRCAKLRAAKAEVDDEVIMLNVLATISGRFFGQSKN